jgi:hypothetical protein
MNGFGDVPAYILAITEVCTNPSCWTPTSTSSCGTLLVAGVARKLVHLAPAKGRHMNHAHHAMPLCRQRNSAGTFDVNGTVGLCGRLGQNADEIEDRIRPDDRAADACLIEYIRLDNLR